MDISALSNTLVKTFNRVKFTVSKNSPEILLGAGIIGGIGSAVLACKSTTKLNEIVDDSKEKVDQIHACLDGEVPIKEGETYTQEDANKDLAITYVQTGVEIAKLYAPSIVLGAASIACVCASHGIMSKRNAGLAAAYATVDQGFKKYRENVVERFGKQVDKELKYGLKSETVSENVSDPETGKTKKHKKDILVRTGDDSDLGDYVKFYDETCKGWTKDAELNRSFLVAQQTYANQLLERRGHVFLNDVFDLLGMKRTQAGSVVGWIYDDDNEEGDNHIDFGFMDANRPGTRDFVNGYEPVVLLNFNVDGPIWNKIDTHSWI